ncbi:unnamed protein product, partial [Vitis vinifera]|uniref:Uncharacterized protein n=1 Tax=Vitis vinifera TaxID=29760 RepID=D7TTS1_VITVI
MALNPICPFVFANFFTKEPCITLNREPSNTPTKPNMWNGCIRMLCSAWNTIMKLKVPEIPRRSYE